MLVAVVGAGIMGASLALHLARSGVTVLLFDAAEPGSGVTASTFACLNFFAGTTSQCMQFRSEALNYHAQLADQIGLTDALRAKGTLRWATGATQAKQLLQAATMAEGLGRTVEYLSRNDALNLEPNLSISGCPKAIIRLPEEGWLDSVRFTRRMIDCATATGLTHYIAEKCTRIEPVSQGAVLWSSRTCYRVDAIVLANGTGINCLLEDLGYAPLINEVPGVLALVQYSGPQVEHIIYADHIHFRTEDPSSLMIGNADDPTGLPDAAVAVKAAAENVSLVSRELKTACFGQSITVKIGTRPIPKDGYPIVGRLPHQERIYIAGAHAAVTVAPYIALLLTAEIANEASREELAAFRLERFDRSIGQN